MDDISVSYFMKNCLRLLKQVNRTKKVLRITQRGSALAEVVPVQSDGKRFVLGDMVGTAEIVGDIVSPAISLNEVETYRD